MHLLIQRPRTARPGAPRTPCAALRHNFGTLWALVLVACHAPPPNAAHSPSVTCFRVTPTGFANGQDAANVAMLFRLVRMDTTHIRWATDVDPAMRALRYLYLDSAVEALGWHSNVWLDEPRSDSLRWSAGNDFRNIELVLTRHGRTLRGYATVGGDIPGVPRRVLGPVRADPVACGPLRDRRPPAPDSGWAVPADRMRSGSQRRP